MSLYHNIVAFSPKGDYLAYSSPDGCLKIWETSTSTLKQEYTPSSHLSATCSALSWGPCKQTQQKKNSKKLKSGSLSAIENLRFIAMGTMVGDVILYSLTKAELHSCLTNGHTNAVNDLSWCASTKSLYTCSKDQHIIVWDVISGKMKTKWKADKVTVNSICVVDENNVLSASSSISWWNVKEQSVIRTFSGHATEIFRLLPIKTVTPLKSYFTSSALGDRVINAWELTENNKRNAASFITNGEPGNIDICVEENEPFRMSVVTKDGTFHLFEHFLNEKRKKPVMPKVSIQIATKASDGSTKPQSVPILAASMSEGLDSCILMYGNFLRPVFERINASEISQNAVLVRDLSFSRPGHTVLDSVSKIKKPERPSDVKMIAPGYMADSSLSKSKLKKRKKEDIDNKELPMEELLKALDLSKTPENVSEEKAFKADSLVHLLVQGLQSKDRTMLDTVLNNGTETVIFNTLERIPLTSVLLLLQELQIRISKQESRHHPAKKWLKMLLSLHLPYLMSIKDIGLILGPMHQIIQARLENFQKMSQLKGCLKVVMAQAAANSNEITDFSSEPLTEYVSESSDENEDEESEDESDSDEEQVKTPTEDENCESGKEESENGETDSDMEDDA